MARLAGGHDAALSDLMDRHAERVFHYLSRSLQNDEDAADLAQETFVRVYQNRGRFNPRQRFTTWLFAIASNLVRDRFRWRARHRQVSLDAGASDSESSLGRTLVDASPAPDENLQAGERVEAVKRAIGSLPQELSQPLILATYEGLSQAEIGAILGCSAKAVETRIYRARNLLRERLGAVLKQV